MIMHGTEYTHRILSLIRQFQQPLRGLQLRAANPRSFDDNHEMGGSLLKCSTLPYLMLLTQY